MLTTQRLVERSLTQFATRTALIDHNRRLTYGVLAKRSAALANALLEFGASGERPVAALLPNENRMVEIDVAAMRAGICRVAIGTRLTADECRYIINHSRSAVLVTTPELWEKIRSAEVGDLKKVILVGCPTASGFECDYETIVDSSSENLTVPPVSAVHPAYLLYTSGTTGRPKGAAHSHGGRVAALVNMLAAELHADSTSVMVHVGPLSHGSGSKVLSFLALGATNLILPKFEPELMARAIEKNRGTHSFMVPTMLQMLLESGPQIRETIRGLSQISFGGAPITNSLFGRALEEFGPILTQVYGSCEAPHPITVLEPADYIHLRDPSVMAQSAGRASCGTDIAILDDSGRSLEPGEEGELHVSGAHLMLGYWRDNAATAEVFSRPGWYSTGDIARLDEDGFVYFHDRKRDLVITGGLNVYPSEVERVLAEHPNVREVAVVGAPDPLWGEAVVACIVPHDKNSVREDELIAWVASRLAGYKKPKRIVLMDELPKGSTNKVLKRELKASFWTGQDRLVN